MKEFAGAIWWWLEKMVAGVLFALLFPILSVIAGNIERQRIAQEPTWGPTPQRT